MNKNLILLIQKIVGILLMMVTIFTLPHADGDATYALITIILGLVLIFSNSTFLFDDLLEEDEDEEEWDEL